jgi:hypothetical protein
VEHQSSIAAQTKLYWDRRYAGNGDSGPGSVGYSRAWKWGIITRYCPDYHESSLIDVGCGDLSFWDQRSLPNSYTGIDMSRVIIQKNQMKYGSNGARFVNCGAEERQPISARIVLCLDMLFHILDEQQYVAILENLCAYSAEYLFVYTWIKNPFLDPALAGNLVMRLKFRDLVTGLLWGRDRYQMYRDFSSYLRIFHDRGFRLETVELAGGLNPYAAMMVFRGGWPAH